MRMPGIALSGGRVKLWSLMALAVTLAACAGVGERPLIQRPPDAVVAKVGGEPIKQADVDRRMAEFQQMGGAGRADRADRMARAALEQLIDEKVIEHQIAAEKIQIPEGALQARMRQMAQDMAREGGSLEVLRASLGATTETLRNMVRRRMAVDAFWDKRLGLKPPTEEELRRYYDRNPKVFMTLPAVHLFMIYLPYSNPRPTLAERSALRDKAEALHARLLTGEKFEDVAKSAGGRQGTPDGDMGWVDAGAPLPPDVLKAALGLKAGQIAKPIASMDGVYLLAVRETRGAEKIPYAEARDRLALDLMQQARIKRIPGELKRMRREAQIERL